MCTTSASLWSCRALKWATCPLYCRHIGAHCSTHIVLLHRNRHYECVRWHGRTLFQSSHPLVLRLRQLCVTNPPYSYKEDDLTRAPAGTLPLSAATSGCRHLLQLSCHSKACSQLSIGVTAQSHSGCRIDKALFRNHQAEGEEGNPSAVRKEVSAITLQTSTWCESWSISACSSDTLHEAIPSFVNLG